MREELETVEAAPSETRSEETEVVVIFFDDMKGSTVLKERLAAASDEQAFQILRKEHDALVSEVITRDGAGEVIKSTGDGLLAIFRKPSVAVERAIEIQERFHEHPFIKVRIGMDMGEVSVESDSLRHRDAFGRHVDWASRAMELSDAGHICVTRSVYTDAFSWIRKSRIAWKEHGPHRVKAGEVPLEIFEPYNANVVTPLEVLRGEKVTPDIPEVPAAPVAVPGAVELSREDIRLARSWEAVARDGREFALNGAGMMYWFKVPLGGVCYPEGFRNFLQPALENPRISKIRFMLDSSSEKIPQIWKDLVLPLLEDWAQQRPCRSGIEGDDMSGRFFAEGEHNVSVGWVFGDLSQEFTPCFKLFVQDPDTDEDSDVRAQIFLATAFRTVRFKDGSVHQVRIPDAVLRVEPRGNDSLLQALNVVANQWDALFI
ncbi:MAG TPA: adenylate/guanylate cyclase domain-containing protein [Actinomycetota bacterium]|nr:adenylate/guanylate cyclase domain-containing protein [Actinomycetota bacterium]